MSIHTIDLTQENIDEIENKSHPENEFEYLVTSHQIEVREHVAKNPNLPAKFANWMAEDVQVRVRQSLATNPNISENLILKLANDKKISVRCAIAKHLNLPNEYLVQFSKDQSYLLRDAAASNPSISQELLRNLSQDTEWGVRRSVASNPKVKSEILSTLSGDTVIEVVDAVSKNHQTSPEILLRLLETSGMDQKNRYRSAVLMNPSFPESKAIEIYLNALSPVASEPEEEVDEDPDLVETSDDRISVAQRPNLSNTFIEKIVVDPYSIVRSYLARNECVTDIFLSQLALDSDESVRTDVYKNPNSSAETKASAVLLGLEEGSSND
jgi:hypothetical protein